MKFSHGHWKQAVKEVNSSTEWNKFRDLGE